MSVWKFSMWNKGLSEHILNSLDCPAEDEGSLFSATPDQAAKVYFTLLRTGKYARIKYEAIA